MNASTAIVAHAPYAPAAHSRGRSASGERLAVGAVALATAALPLLRPSGPGNTAPLVDGLIVLAVGATLLWAGSSGVRLRLPYGLAIGLLIAAGALAGLLGPFPDVSVLALTQDLFLLAWCAALMNVSRTPSALNTVVRTWAGTAILWAAALDLLLLTGKQSLAGVTGEWGGRAALTFGDPNMAASYYLLSIMVIAATRYPRRPVLRMGAYLLLLGAIAYTGSNGGMVALLIGTLGGMILLVRRRAGAIAALVATLGLVVLAAGLFSQVKIDDVRRLAHASGQQLLIDSVGRTDESAALREVLLTQSVALFTEGAPLGWGAGAAESALADRQSHFRKNTHNDYVAALIERGILGTVGLVLLIASIAVRARSVVKGQLAPAFALVVPRPEFLVGAVLGIGVTALFYQVLHFRHVWALLAIIAAVALWSRE